MLAGLRRRPTFPSKIYSKRVCEFFNHRSLQLHTDLNDTPPAALTIFGYCHAFQRWFEIPETEAGGEGQITITLDETLQNGQGVILFNFSKIT